MLLRRGAVVVGLVLSVGSRPALADRERLLLVAPPQGLARAVRTALSSWPIEVVVLTSDGPGATMPSSAARARAIARAGRAGAVVWLSDDGAGGRALWIFDAESGRVSARPLTTEPPFDDPTAAAVALTIKTLVRHSAVVPVEERYGSRGALAASGPPRPSPRAVLRLDTGGGLRIRRTGAGDLEPRLSIALRFAPARLSSLGALAIGVRLGPGVSVDQPDFVGHYSDLEVNVSAMGRVPMVRRLALWPRLDASLHRTEIDGSIPGSSTRARAARLNPALGTGLVAEVEVGRSVRLGLGGEVSYALRRQVYLVSGEPVLRVPRLEAELGLSVSLPLR